MTATPSIQTARSQLTALERRGESWMLDRREVEESHDFGEFLSEVNGLLPDIFELDLRLQEEAFGGKAHGEDVARFLEVVFLKALFLAKLSERSVRHFENLSGAVEEADELRRWLTDLEACNSSHTDEPEWLMRKKDAALDAFDRGATVEGLVD